MADDPQTLQFQLGQITERLGSLVEESKAARAGRNRLHARIDDLHSEVSKIETTVTSLDSSYRSLDARLRDVEPQSKFISDWKQRLIGARLLIALVVMPVAGASGAVMGYFWKPISDWIVRHLGSG